METTGVGLCGAQARRGRCLLRTHLYQGDHRLGLAGKHRAGRAPKEMPVLQAPGTLMRKAPVLRVEGSHVPALLGRPLGQRGLEKGVWQGVQWEPRTRGFGGAALQAWLVSQEDVVSHRGLGRVRERETRPGPDLARTARLPAGVGDTHWARLGRKRRELATRLWRSHQVSSGVRLGQAGDGLQGPGAQAEA